jgi:hypothetical protein
MTTTQTEFVPKKIVFTETAEPNSWLPVEKKQITYTTTYGINFPNMLDYESKII